jgi:hypothetical protein
MKDKDPEQLEYIEAVNKDLCPYIRSTPGLTSLLYDIDLLPEQQLHTGLAVNALRMAAVCELYKLAYPEVPLVENNSPRTLPEA